MINLTVHSIDEITEYFTHEVNNLLFDPKREAEEQRESSEMRDLDLCWIKLISSKDYRTDARNESSAQIAAQLAKLPFLCKQMAAVNNKKMAMVAEQMARQHRTLQQTFSKLVFYHFALTCEENDSKILYQNMGDSFFLLPLI